MTDWTITRVQDRLELAADVMRQMPGVKPQGHFNAWPEYFHSFADKVGQEPKMRRPLPSPRMITEADEAMLWLRWLEVKDAKLVWARAERVAWKQITWQFGLSRTAGQPTVAVRLGGDRLAAAGQATTDATIDELRDREGQNGSALRHTIGPKLKCLVITFIITRHIRRTTYVQFESHRYR